MFLSLFDSRLGRAAAAREDLDMIGQLAIFAKEVKRVAREVATEG